MVAKIGFVTEAKYLPSSSAETAASGHRASAAGAGRTYARFDYITRMGIKTRKPLLAHPGVRHAKRPGNLAAGMLAWR